jgi:hypothetical protein
MFAAYNIRKQATPKIGRIPLIYRADFVVSRQPVLNHVVAYQQAEITMSKIINLCRDFDGNPDVFQTG